jgi:hypothetical protein
MPQTSRPILPSPCRPGAASVRLPDQSVGSRSPTNFGGGTATVRHHPFSIVATAGLDDDQRLDPARTDADRTARMSAAKA